MAIVSKDSPYHGRRCRLGPLVFREMNGQTVVQAAGRKPSGPASAAQLAQRGLMFRSRQYGKVQSDNPAAKAVYATGTSRKYPSAYAVAARDYRNPPEITLLDVSSYYGRTGDPIRVLATDDFGVVAVQVRITGPGGQLQEAGPAALQADGSWRYEVSTTAPVGASLAVTAEAYDRPGNAASAQQVVETTEKSIEAPCSSLGTAMLSLRCKGGRKPTGATLVGRATFTVHHRHAAGRPLKERPSSTQTTERMPLRKSQGPVRSVLTKPVPAPPAAETHYPAPSLAPTAPRPTAAATARGPAKTRRQSGYIPGREKISTPIELRAPRPGPASGRIGHQAASATVAGAMPPSYRPK